LAESAGRNPLAAKGIPTCLHLNPQTPTVVNYIMAVARIPAGFDRVTDIRADARPRGHVATGTWFTRADAVTLRAASG
jgi:hypothetical protein